MEDHNDLINPRHPPNRIDLVDHLKAIKATKVPIPGDLGEVIDIITPLVNLSVVRVTYRIDLVDLLDRIYHTCPKLVDPLLMIY